MLFTNGSDNGNIRVDDRAQNRNFSRDVGARFDYRNLRFRRNRENRQWDANAVVEIPRSGMNIHRAAERSTNDVLCRGFPIAAGNHDNRPAPRPAPGARKLPEGNERVRHQEHRHAGIRCRLFRNYDCNRALLDRGLNEIVSVELLADERDEKLSLGNRARVGRDPRNRSE